MTDAAPNWKARPARWVVAGTGTAPYGLRTSPAQSTSSGNYAHQALPGVLTGLGVAGLSIVAGFLTWLLTFINRHRTVSRREP
jgi:hypothetical protein